MTYSKGFKTLAQSGSKLINPNSRNGVFLNFWSPGYSIIDKKIAPNGKEIIKKRFVPTTSFEAALTILNKKYGPEDFLKFKHDASPGHVSVAVSDEYLSVGPFVESLNEVGVHTQYKMHYAPHYASDILSFERAPEKTIDFYTLNSSDIREAIKEFKSSSTVYSLLGGRLYGSDGESCATTCFIALEAGGIQELFPMHKGLMAKHGILTPRLLLTYSEEARIVEQERFPELAEISDEALQERKTYVENVLTRSRQAMEEEDTAHSNTLTDDKDNDPSPGGPK